MRGSALWSRIKAEDAGHDVAQLLRQRDFASAAPIGSAGMVVELDIGVKRRQQIARLPFSTTGRSAALR